MLEVEIKSSWCLLNCPTVIPTILQWMCWLLAVLARQYFTVERNSYLSQLHYYSHPLPTRPESLTHHQCQWEGRRVFWDIWSTWMFHNEWCSAHFECLQRMNLLQSITMLMYWWWSSPSKAGRQGSEERVFCYPPTSALTRGGQCRPPWPGGSPWCRGPSPCHSHWRECESSEERGLQNSREVYRSVSEAYFEQKSCE